MPKCLTLTQLPAWWRDHLAQQELSLIAIGGGGLSRKPLGLLAQLLAWELLPATHWLTPVGGADIDVLLAHGCVQALTASYVGFDHLGLSPHFRKARQQGTLCFHEWSEFAVIAALRAALERLPFHPARIGGDVATRAGFHQFVAPYTGESLTAIPARVPDLALLHVDIADPAGNACIFGDLHIDPLVARAARHTLISAERIVEPAELLELAGRAGCELLGIDVDAVVELPGGYGFSAALPQKPLDAEGAQAYLQLAQAAAQAPTPEPAVLAELRAALWRPRT